MCQTVATRHSARSSSTLESDSEASLSLIIDFSYTTGEGLGFSSSTVRANGPLSLSGAASPGRDQDAHCSPPPHCMSVR